VRVESADVFEAEALGEELGELEDFGKESVDGGFEGWVVGFAGHLGVVVAHHGDAGRRGDDDGFGVAELVDEPLEEGESFGLVAGVVVHLAAAGLCKREVDRVTQAFQHARHRDACLRKQGVVIAGNKERDTQKVSSVMAPRRRANLTHLQIAAVADDHRRSH
jgi:hypothetical protein